MAKKEETEISVEAPIICGSCKRRITNIQGSVRFMCPNCGKYEIVRCRHCREIVAKYKCIQCGFRGPN